MSYQTKLRNTKIIADAVLSGKGFKRGGTYHASFDYAHAKRIADKYAKLLAPFCERIEVAGSIRRGKSFIKDVEIICIPKKREVAEGFFDTREEPVKEFVDLVNGWEKVRGEPTGKYTARKLPEGINLDLFIADELNWGFQFAIRTGPADFNRRMISLLKKNYKYARDGYVWNTADNKLLECGDEIRFFNLCGVKFIEPEFRI